MTGILLGLLLLSLIMILHELGHFIAGLLNGFKIEEFSLFMGPVIFEREIRGVRFNIKLLPIGASVGFAGEAQTVEAGSGDQRGPDAAAQGLDPQDPGLFYNRPRWRRAIVVAMGPIVNFISAILAFLILFSMLGVAVPVLETPPENTLLHASSVRAGDQLLTYNGRRIHTAMDFYFSEALERPGDAVTLKVRHASGTVEELTVQSKLIKRQQLGITYLNQNGQMIVETVRSDSNQGKPVLQPGDILLTVDDIPFGDPRFHNVIDASAGKTLHVRIIRDGVEQTVGMSTILVEYRLPSGIYLQGRRNFGSVLQQALLSPWSIVRGTGLAFSKMIAGQIKPQDTLAGPLAIVTTIGSAMEVAQPVGLKLAQFLQLFAMISVAVGFTNLLPIPPFDGSHLLIMGIEGLIRRDLPDKLKQTISLVGFALIMVLFVVVLYFDIMRLLG